MRTINSWWLQILTVLGVILDLGFDVVNPLLSAVGLADNWVVLIKVLFGIFAVVKSKMQTPPYGAKGTEGVDLIGGRPNDR